MWAQEEDMEISWDVFSIDIVIVSACIQGIHKYDNCLISTFYNSYTWTTIMVGYPKNGVSKGHIKVKPNSKSSTNIFLTYTIMGALEEDIEFYQHVVEMVSHWIWWLWMSNTCGFVI